MATSLTDLVKKRRTNWKLCVDALAETSILNRLFGRDQRRSSSMENRRHRFGRPFTLERSACACRDFGRRSAKYQISVKGFVHALTRSLSARRRIYRTRAICQFCTRCLHPRPYQQQRSAHSCRLSASNCRPSECERSKSPSSCTASAAAQIRCRTRPLYRR